jgi:hypothetical protein
MKVDGEVALVAVADPGAARAALARAIASGALGPGRIVRLDGDAVIVDGGRIELDGERARFALATDGDVARFAQAAGLAALTSVAATILFSWFFFVSLPVGLLVGATWATVKLLGDRRRVARDVKALLASLPLLVDARGEQPR